MVLLRDIGEEADNAGGLVVSLVNDQVLVQDPVIGPVSMEEAVLLD